MNWGFRAARSILIASSCILPIGLVSPDSTFAAINIGATQTRLEKGDTGTAPFDANNDPGNDANANNDVVRTYDTVAYDVVYVVTDSSEDVVITLTLSSDRVDGQAGQLWTELPALCSGATSSIVGDTLTCDLGDITAPSGGSVTGRLTVLAEISPDTPNGANVNVTASISATGEGTTALNTITDTVVSATPKPDLSKTGISDASDPDLGINPSFVGIRPNPTGGSDQGAVYAYPLALLVSGGKGGEALQGDINITDNLSSHSPNALLYKDSDGNASNDGDYSDDDNGCNWNGSSSLTGISPFGSLPVGKTFANGGENGPDEEAVTDSGTWTCSQVGSNINITITGADLSGVVTPSLNRNGSVVAATDRYLLSGVVMIWVPLSDITGSELTVTNQYDAIQVTGISSTVVTESGAALDNNDSQHTILAGSGNFSTYYINSADDSDRNNPVPGQTETNSGNGAVMPSQTYGLRLTARNSGVAPWSSDPVNDPFMLCAKIDNQTQVVTEIGSGSGIAHTVDFDPDNATFNYSVEYGTGDYTTAALDDDTDANLAQVFENQRLARCRDSDSPDGWSSDLNSLPAGVTVDDITKVRFVANEELGSDERVSLYINLTARSTEPDGDVIDPGRILSNHSASRVDIINTNNANQWTRGGYAPLTHTSPNRGDRLFLTRAIARLDKTVNGSVSASVQADNTVTFTLTPTLSAPIATSVTTDLSVTDTLPSLLVYQDGTATGCDSGATPACTMSTPVINGDGTTTLVWTWTDVTPGTVIPSVSFDALASPLATTGSTLTNTAVVDATVDETPEDQRTDTASVIVTNTAAFGIFKQTVNPLLTDNGTMVFSLLFANTGAQPVTSGLFIDVLPYNSDGRSPESTFTGTLIYSSISGSNGETFQFTNETDRALLNSPDDPNLIAGVTWCTEIQFGTAGCPAVDGSDVTAVLISMPNFPSGDPIRQVDLTLETVGATGDNTYTNDFRGLPEGLGVLTSNAVPVTVQVPVSSSPELQVVKRITAVNGTSISAYADNTTDIGGTATDEAAADNHANWPTPLNSDAGLGDTSISTYLNGAIDAGQVDPGQDIEYTIYFLSSGDKAVTNVNICDMIPANTTYVPNSMSWQLGSAASASTLTDASSDDIGEFYTSGDTPSVPCPTDNGNGAVVFNVAQVSAPIPTTPPPTELPAATTPGSPTNSYGYVRFRVTVD